MYFLLISVLSVALVKYFTIFLQIPPSIEDPTVFSAIQTALKGIGLIKNTDYVELPEGL